MARSPAHKLGQVIGDLLEEAMRSPLEAIAVEFGLYLDSAGARAAREGRRKVSWRDGRGNWHDLDYVLEKDGSDAELGQPRAFIETAWRRYTKHSRNKVQEIQSALAPLAATYGDPFLGVILAGEFTGGSVEQLESHGFRVVHFPYRSLVAAFGKEGVDILFGEATEPGNLQEKVEAAGRLGPEARKRIAADIRTRNEGVLAPFLESLRGALGRRVARVSVLPLRGDSRLFDSVGAALRFVVGHEPEADVGRFVRYEIHVTYSNGDELKGRYRDKADAASFLRRLEP